MRTDRRHNVVAVITPRDVLAVHEVAALGPTGSASRRGAGRRVEVLERRVPNDFLALEEEAGARAFANAAIELDGTTGVSVARNRHSLGVGVDEVSTGEDVVRRTAMHEAGAPCLFHLAEHVSSGERLVGVVAPVGGLSTVDAAKRALGRIESDKSVKADKSIGRSRAITVHFLVERLQEAFKEHVIGFIKEVGQLDLFGRLETIGTLFAFTDINAVGEEFVIRDVHGKSTQRRHGN